MQLADILRTAHEHESSDIHLISGHPPMMRVRHSQRQTLHQKL